jgi:hypothetical protein
MEKYQIIDNQILIANGLLHTKYELDRQERNYFRIARESHLIFYRSAIESLRGSSNFSVTLDGDKNYKSVYKYGDAPSFEIHKEILPNCSYAWRFSSPMQVPDTENEGERYSEQENTKERRIGFYVALAMIQTECFMSMYVNSKVSHITDEEMKILEWLHEAIRNEFEHFIPKIYSASPLDLLKASQVALINAKYLLFDSGNVIFNDDKALLNDDFNVLLSGIKSLLTNEVAA